MKNRILERWEAVLAEKGDAAAVVTSSGEVARTFAELDEEAEVVARKLARWPAGTVVTLQVPNSACWPALVLGIWKADACALLMDVTASGDTRDEVESVCGAQARLTATGEEGWQLEAIGGSPANFGCARPDLIKLTSGTSGKPRAILFRADQLVADCDQICVTMGIRSNDLNYGVIAFSHSYGFSNLITPLLCRGVPLVAANDPLPRALLTGLAATRATVLPAVPAIFQALAGVEGSVPALRLCISAGAPLAPATAVAFRRRFGLKVHTFYGASECGGITYDGGDAEHDMPGLVGQPVQGVRLRNLGAGEVRVESAAVGLGYFPAGEGDRLGSGAFSPSDLLEETPEGWRLLGRLDDLINVGGKKVNPIEIEAALLAHPAVREAVAFAVEDAGMRTQSIQACVVLDGELPSGELRRFCADRLASWQVPREIHPLHAFPVNARGKVSRRDLARRYSA